MFGWEFPPHNSGGLGVACQGLANSLASKDIDLTFVLPKKVNVSGTNIKFKFANVPNLNLIEIDSILASYMSTDKYTEVKALLENKDANYGNTLFEEVKRYGLLARSIAKNVPHDIIHAHDWLAYGAGLSSKNVSNKPFVAHMHATEIDRTAGKPNPYIYEKEKEGVQSADKVLAVSGYTKDTLLNHYGVSEEKVGVVHNGIDSNRYVTEGDISIGLKKLKELGYKVVLFVGRITIMKGPDYLLTAAKRVLQHNPKTIFMIAGSGDMEEQIMGQAAAMGMSDKFVFAGFVRGADLSEAYRAADIFIMPSVSEPFGLVALEALIHKTPVIISKQSGVSEVLKNAMKVDFWDTEEMADKILSVLNHSSVKKELTDNGHKEAHLCNWDRAADKVIDVYNQLI